MRKLLTACLVLSSWGVPAQSLPPARVDLDRPGALAALEKDHPERYRTVVLAVRATERMNCVVDLKLYQAGEGSKACRSHIIRTSYPAQVVLSIPLDRTLYTITAYLDRSQDGIIPAK